VQIAAVNSARALAAAVFLVLSASAAAQQPVAPPERTMDAGPPLSVYVITMGQGDPLWTRFGHNALWIRDRENGRDVAYNWGLFDFDEPGFLLRFFSGDTRYWMAGFDTWEMLAVYRLENRTIDVQELALPQETARALYEFVEWNALPENRSYRYDYFLDNCSTRIRDALDRVLAGQIGMATNAVETGRSYRWHGQRLLAGLHAAYFGSMVVLGQPGDRSLSAWEEMFLPVMMRDRMRTVEVSDGAGGRSPLVANEWRLYTANRPAERDTAPNRLPVFGLLGLLLGAAVAGLAWYGTRAGGVRAARTAATSLAAMWSLVAGIAGLAILVFWMATEHVFMYANENILQFNPLSLILLGLLPFTTRAHVDSRIAHVAALVALTIAGLSAAGFAAQVLPWFFQGNGEMIALTLPANVGVAAAVWLLAHGERWTASPATEPRT
jgi:hypothetical protein